MAVVDAHTNLWEALLGRAPARPLPADADIWRAVTDRLNPARARPVVRAGVERMCLRSARSGEYVMLRSPDGRDSAYVRLAPEEAELLELMDGTRTVARLVGDFARSSGRLAPEQVTRVIADLAGARMLEELPSDAYRPLAEIGRRSLLSRALRGLLAAAGGRRMVLADPDRLADVAYRFGGRLLFTRLGAAVMALVSVAGLIVWVQSWAGGARQATVAGGSYGAGAILLLGLNVAGLACHEAGHALAVKHAGRRVPALGVMLYFGIPSAYVDTTDIWMSSRRHRLIATGAGPGFSITFAGVAQLGGLLDPGIAAVAFPLGFAWYLNSLFNLNPLMALDGYYLVMDWLEVPNLRPRGVAFIIGVLQRPSLLRVRRTGEDVLVARYAVLALLWVVIFTSVMARSYKDRFSGMWAGLGQNGWASRLLLASVVALVLAPVLVAVVRSAGRRAGLARRRQAERWADRDRPRRLDALRASRLATLPPEQLEALADRARWVRPRRGGVVLAAGAPVEEVLVVIEGALEGRRPGDPDGYVRARADAGEPIGSVNVLGGLPSSLGWSAAGTTLLAIPAATFLEVLGPTRGPSPETEGEVDELFEVSPLLGHLGNEHRAALAATMHPADASPGRGFELRGGWAAIVGAGVVRTSDGREVRRGELVGPASYDAAIRAETRTRARLWTFPVTGSFVALTVGTASGAPARRSPAAGMHGDAYGPLMLPWGSSPPPPDAELDERLRRSFGSLLLVVLVLALLCTWVASRPGMAWAEIPDDTAILEARRGTVLVVIDGRSRRIERGHQVLVRTGDEVVVGPRALGRLEARGGAHLVLCPRTEIDLDRVASSGTDPSVPVLDVRLRRGRVVADGRSSGAGFSPARLDVRRADGVVVTTEDGGAFATGAGSLVVAAHTVVADGTTVPVHDEPSSCGTVDRGEAVSGTGPGGPRGTGGLAGAGNGEGSTSTTTGPAASLPPDAGGAPGQTSDTGSTTATTQPGGATPTSGPSGGQPGPTTSTTAPGSGGSTPPASTTTTTTTATTSTTRPPPDSTTTTTRPPRTTTTSGR